MLRGLRRLGVVVARKVAALQSRLLLALMYFVVIAPFAVAVRLFSDPLRLREPSSWDWHPPDQRPSLGSVQRQF